MNEAVVDSGSAPRSSPLRGLIMNEAVVDSQIQPSKRVNNEGLSSARIVVQSPFHSGGYYPA